MRLIARFLAVALLAGIVGWAILTRPNLTPAARGERVAETSGCFTCHGPGGIRGVANHGRLDRTVPGFEGDVMMYAKNDDEIGEWIRDGVTKRRAPSHTWQDQRKRGALHMPAFGKRLSAAEITDLVAFVNASAGNPEPEDSLAAAGLAKADSLGCTGCHGPGGRLSPRNAGSLKGYVPSWDGRDFPELVHDRAEFEHWVADGVAPRLGGNPAARFFLRRAALHMPSYRAHLAPGDLDALWAYVTWLRATPH